jgi:hypothetical protein
VLDGANESSSLVVSLSTAAAANGVRWETRSVLVAALSHFSELETKLELLRSGRNTDLMEDQVDALWI